MQDPPKGPGTTFDQAKHWAYGLTVGEMDEIIQDCHGSANYNYQRAVILEQSRRALKAERAFGAASL
jgi:hypothetical protein